MAAVQSGALAPGPDHHQQQKRHGEVWFAVTGCLRAMIKHRYISRNSEIMRSWLIFGYYSRNCLKGLSKTTETTDIDINKTDFRGRIFLQKIVVAQLVN
jgi:hypothetical protein